MKRRGIVSLDTLGVCASSLCMVHCLAFPVLLAALPLWQMSAGTRGEASTVSAANEPVEAQGEYSCPTSGVNDCCPNESSGIAATVEAGNRPACCSTPLDYWIHVGMLATVAPMGLIAWGGGFLRHHNLRIPILGFVGVALLCGALLFGHQLFQGRGEPILTIAGSVCMVSAHLWNRQKCRCCRTSEPTRIAQSVAPETQQISPTS